MTMNKDINRIKVVLADKKRTFVLGLTVLSTANIEHFVHFQNKFSEIFVHS